MRNARSYAKGALASLFILGLLGFAVFALRGVLFPPRVIFTTIHDGMTVPQGVLTIEGRTKRVDALIVQGRRITRSPDGMFTTEVAVFHPYTIIEVQARDIFNKTTTYTIRLSVEE